jgi:hypothetical protein
MGKVNQRGKPGKVNPQNPKASTRKGMERVERRKGQKLSQMNNEKPVATAKAKARSGQGVAASEEAKVPAGLAMDAASAREKAQEETFCMYIGQEEWPTEEEFVNFDKTETTFPVGGKTLTLVQEGDMNAQSGETGGVVWGGAFILAKFLEHQAAQGSLEFSDTRCLELGAGCGLVGLSLATLGARSVVMTDQANVLPLLGSNAKRNGLANECHILELLWGDVRVCHRIQAKEAVDYLLVSHPLASGPLCVWRSPTCW